MPGASLHADGATSTAEEDGDVAVAQGVQERMVLDGSRLQVKEWLLDALESAGWCATMDRAAAQYSSENSNATVGQIYQGIARKGFESIPEDIRNKLVAQLLTQVQSFEPAGATSPAKSKLK